MEGGFSHIQSHISKLYVAIRDWQGHVCIFALVNS